METITGFVDHIVFQNSENGYTVMILSTEGEEMTCVGMCKGLTQGENISAEGEYIEHPVYGRQFKIRTYETVTPTDPATVRPSCPLSCLCLRSSCRFFTTSYFS